MHIYDRHANSKLPTLLISSRVPTTQGDSDVISSYHIHASCFPAMMWGKLGEMFFIVTSLFLFSRPDNLC